MAKGLQHGVRGAVAVVCLALGVIPCASATARATSAAVRDDAASTQPSHGAVQVVDPAAQAVDATAQAVDEAAVDAGKAPVERLSRAFQARAPDEPLSDRVDRTRAEASRMGMWSAEPAARGLLLAHGLGKEPERASAAVRLGPGLPAAWGAAALADPGLDSGPALLRALLEMERNLQASLWWRANAWYVLAWGLVVGGLLFLVVSAVRLAPSAAHDLGHRLPGELPPHAIGALLASVGLLPAALGEGLVGLAAGAFVVAFPWAASRHRAALLAALAGVMAGVHPVTAETGRWIAALHADPATIAIHDAEVGDLTPYQRERLARIADRDPAASHALAVWSKRSDRLDEAWQWLERADASDSTSPVLLNDAANVRLAMGDSRGAIRLYEAAVKDRPDAAVLFNLAQVYGSRIELGRQETVLEAAHAASAATVRELSDLRGNGRLAVDIGWPVSDLRDRLASAADGDDVAAALRASFGSGRLVQHPFLAPGVLLAIAIVGSAIGRGRIASRVCGVCHARRCDQCVPRRAIGCSVCGAPGSSLRVLDFVVGLGRPAALRAVPGLAAVVADQPFAGWAATLAAATACSAFMLRGGVVPDPLVVGDAGRLAFGGAAVLLALVWASATWWSLRGVR